MKNTLIGLDILRLLAVSGLKIFTVHQARVIAQKQGASPGYVVEALHYLQKGDWIIRIKRGVYALSSSSGYDAPHEFAIAMALVSPCAISHWTAMHYHHLTQQSPNTVFAMTLPTSSIPRRISKKKYHFVRTKNEHFFGTEKIWINDSQVQITDPERTLLDGLMAPQYCGDFQEVLHAFKMYGDRINIERIVQYALKLDQSTVKRLGWVLEKIGFKDESLVDLLRYPIQGYRKLDPTGLKKGPYNKKWMLQENIGLL